VTHPRATLLEVDESPAPNLPAVRFADAARRLGAAGHAAGLTVPAFRCPPRVAGATRTIRRYPGGAVVSVRLRGRPFAAALEDMVEGMLVANRVDRADQPRLRALLVDAVAESVEPAARAA
jgi:hypothetical protein